MKVSYFDTTISIDLVDDTVTTLVIEDKAQYRRMIYELLHQTDGEDGPWVISDNLKCFDLEKQVHLIRDPLNTDVNHKAILTKLQNELIKSSTDYVVELAEINQKIQSLYYSLEGEYVLELQHKVELTAQEIIKLGSFSFNIENSGELSDLLTYIEVVQDLLGPQLFIMFNLGVIASRREINDFFKTIVGKKINLLCLESAVIDEEGIDRLLEVRYILDKDFCFI